MGEFLSELHCVLEEAAQNSCVEVQLEITKDTHGGDKILELMTVDCEVFPEERYMTPFRWWMDARCMRQLLEAKGFTVNVSGPLRCGGVPTTIIKASWA